MQRRVVIHHITSVTGNWYVKSREEQRGEVGFWHVLRTCGHKHLTRVEAKFCKGLTAPKAG